MEEWRKLALLLCVYGVLKELRPLEPYITRFFNEPPMNFSMEQINVEIYPISVYSNLLTLILIFLVTDLLRYKPIIILNSFAGIALYIILIVCRSELAIQFVEVLYGLYISCEVAYYTYIYAKVDPSHYQEVTGYTRAAYLTGRALSGITSQILIACGLHLMTLAHITLGVLIISSLWAISLPSVANSIYFHRSTDLQSPNSDDNGYSGKIKAGFKLLYNDFIEAFSQVDIRKYVFWWALCNGGYLQVLQFVQVLWEETSANSKEELVYNGGVEAVCTFMGALGAFSFGRWRADWDLYGELVLSLGALSLGGVLILMAFTKSMVIAYITYIAFSALYNAVVTIAKSQIACHIKSDSTGLIFGITVFLALILQTLITLILVQYLQFSAKLQFSLYGYYYVLIGIIFGVKWIYSCFTRLREERRTGRNDEKNEEIN
uniref:Thiamine transporter 2 n=1 Tax=Lygus hesperus TaxID=30085 RepID=A0A146LEY1_LYGHE